MRFSVFDPVNCWRYLLPLFILVQISPAFGNCKPSLLPDELGKDWRLTDQIDYADSRLGYGVEFHQNNSKFTLYSFDLGAETHKQPPLRSLFAAAETAIGADLKRYSTDIKILKPWRVPEQFITSAETLEFASVTPLVAPNNLTLSFLGMGRRENCIVKMRLTSKVEAIDRNHLLGFTSFAVKLIAKMEKSLIIQ